MSQTAFGLFDHLGNPGRPQLGRGKETPEVTTLIIVQNDLAQKSGKNNITVAFIDFHWSAL